MKLIIITVKPCMCQRKPNAGWTSWYGKSVSREQAFRDIWNRYCENTSINTSRMWKGGGNSEQLHSSNANPCQVTAFIECSNTAGGLSTSFLILARRVFVPQRLLPPKGRLNHSEVVIRDIKDMLAFQHTISISRF